MHSPEHVRSLAELDDEQIGLVAEAWRRRREADPAGYLHALVNEGKVAGGSLAHSHSQLVWLAGPPPAVTAEHGKPDRDNVVVAVQQIEAARHRLDALPFLALQPRCVRARIVPG